VLFSVPGLIASKSFLGEVHIPIAGMVAFASSSCSAICFTAPCTPPSVPCDHRPGSATDAVAGHDPHHSSGFHDESGAAASQLAAVVLAFDGSVLRAYPHAGTRAHRATAALAIGALRGDHAGNIYGLLALSSRIYRVGILMYGKRPTLAELRRWLRYAG